MLAAWSVLLLGVPSSSMATVTNAVFEHASYVAPLGEPFPNPLRVTVTDEFDAPVAGVEVLFAVSPDSTGAAATLSAPTAMTGLDGVAEIAATAGTEPGFPGVFATVEAVFGQALLVNLPPGFRPGEQLASVVAKDQDNVIQDVRDLLEEDSYLLVDVCASWCTQCQQFADFTEDAIQELMTSYGIDLKVAALLQRGGTEATVTPSIQADATSWKVSDAHSATVFHAEGSLDSELYRAADFFLFADDPEFRAYPTHLLVGPDGVILDRIVGAQDNAATVARVVAAAGNLPARVGKKLIVKTSTSSGKSKLISLQEGAINFGVAGDPALLSGTLEVSYVDAGNQYGALSLPSPWDSNSGTVAKFKNSLAPGGTSEVKAAIVTGTKAKVVAKGLGGLDITSPPEGGGIMTILTINNGPKVTRICTLYDTDWGSTIKHKNTASGSKLTAKNGVPWTCPTPPPPLQCGVTDKCIFVMSAGGNGNFLVDLPEPNGLAAADYYCNNSADQAGLPGTYVAWMSDSTTNAGDRVTSDGPYVTPAGDLVANSLADLVDGSLNTAIDDDENGTTVPPTAVWTGTASTGLSTGGNCLGWTDGTSSQQAIVGLNTSTSSEWTNSFSEFCDVSLPNYCVQQ
jgi:hypothetical protein